MDEENVALNDTGEENTPDTAPVSEETTGEVEETKAEPTGETEVETTETEESSKKGYSQRVRELVKEKNEAKAQAQSLAEKLAELTGSVEPKVDYQPYNPQEPLIAPGEEIDVNELNRRQTVREQKILQQADAMAQLRSKQSEAITRINNEANESVRAYPQLDPTNEAFDKELSDTVTEAAEGYINKNPYTANVKKFVDRLMKPYNRAVTKEVGKATENIAKQVSETALRPTSIPTGEKKFEELSIEEMEKQLGTVVS